MYAYIETFAAHRDIKRRRKTFNKICKKTQKKNKIRMKTAPKTHLELKISNFEQFLMTKCLYTRWQNFRYENQCPKFYFSAIHCIISVIYWIDNTQSLFHTLPSLIGMHLHCKIFHTGASIFVILICVIVNFIMSGGSVISAKCINALT